MSQNTTRPLTERNWADLMDRLIDENFTAYSKSSTQAQRLRSAAEAVPQQNNGRRRATGARPEDNS